MSNISILFPNILILFPLSCEKYIKHVCGYFKR